MYLKEVDIKEFKEIIFNEYKKLFPSKERKSYRILKELYDKNITHIIEIMEDEKFIGFMITNVLENNPYVQLDYFAILPEFQHKGYGSKAMKLLQEMYKSCEGILIEIEKIGNGRNDKENQIRQRRAKFYENLGFCKIGFDINLFSVIFSIYILPCSNKAFLEEKVIQNLWRIYDVTLGKKNTEKNCKIIR